MVSSTSHSHTVVGIDPLAQLPESVVLPPVSSESFISQRHEVNPAMALNLLQDIQLVVVAWKDQLRQLVAALHKLHAQGPMVDGWLESSADRAQPNIGTEATLMRHGDMDALMQYVETLDTRSASASQPPTQPSSTQGSLESTSQAATQYWVCRLDERGHVHSQPCPSEQMGTVSLAIARYQKYKQLLDQKQVIDAKLQRAVDQLTGVRATLNH
ncbi:MAG: hypothetical protein AAFN12_11950 [Cyanobacteria bacterium J06560_2]